MTAASDVKENCEIFLPRRAAENIKAHLSPLEEEAADLNAKIDIRDIIEGIEDHRLKKLLKLCKEKRGKEEEEDVTIEFERALKVEMMMHRAASPEHNREGVWGIGA